MKKYGTWIALGLLFLQAALLIIINVFYAIFSNYDAHRAALAFLFLSCAATAFYYGYLSGWKLVKNIIVTAASAIACPGIVVVLGMYLLNNVGGVSRPVTAIIVVALASLYALVYFILQMIKIADKNVIRKAIACVLSALFLLAECIPPVINHLRFGYKVPTMTGLSQYTAKPYEKVEDADVYVATNGNDETGNGSFGNPYKTIERAKEAVRDIDKTNKSGITVAIKAGEYRTTGLTFAPEDGGTPTCHVTYCAYGDGEVVINGGVTLRPGDFTAVPDGAMKNRLSDKARDKVVCLDLSLYGITKEQYGKIYTIGSYNTAEKYDGDYVGDIYSELFFNDQRMNLARYPDEGYLKSGKVIEMGKGLESDGSKTAAPDYWETVRNPKGDTYGLDKKLTDRIASWQTLEDVWIFGFPKYTWADASTPIAEFNKDKRTLTTKFVSLYGAIQGAPYYFFNVFEELDAPGEWYLDRDAGVLYMYPLAEMNSAVIDLSLTTNTVIRAEADYLTFKKLTVKGTRGDAMKLDGNGNVVTLCTIKNVSGNALLMKGYKNLASENEITRTGKGGITLDGGDRATLTPGENKADNNVIHDWSEIYLTYQPAVNLGGVGNICSHNEMYNSPHEAVTYSGNNNIIEYNNIHNVCLLSDDAGAIYSGRRWDWYGNVIRYNAVYDLGSGEHHPTGIYMDDALSGQTIYGNILVNVPDVGIELGGGRDLIVKNNIIINTNSISLQYDERARDGVIHNGWFDHSTTKGGDMWVNLFESPWQSDVWQNAFPQYKRFSDDFSQTEIPEFVPNPAYSEIVGNVHINLFKGSGRIEDSVYRFSTVKDNPVYYMSAASSIFVDYRHGNYNLKENSRIYKDLPGFEPIPIAEIGRY